MALKLDQPLDTYDRTFFAKVFRKIELWASGVENPGPVYCSSLNISNIQTTGYNLPVGAVYMAGVSGVLHIVQDGENYFQGSSATASLGSVTVTIS